MSILKNNESNNCKIEFKKDEEIYYKNHFKSHVKWIPGTIVHKLTNYLYKIRVNGIIRTAHINQIKKCHKLVRFNTITKYLHTNNNKDTDKAVELEEESDLDDVFYSPDQSEEEDSAESCSNNNKDNVKRKKKYKIVKEPVRKSERIKAIQIQTKK